MYMDSLMIDLMETLIFAQIVMEAISEVVFNTSTLAFLSGL